VPIKPLNKMSEAPIVREMSVLQLAWERTSAAPDAAHCRVAQVHNQRMRLDPAKR
jgi:hypothetical protein